MVGEGFAVCMEKRGEVAGPGLDAGGVEGFGGGGVEDGEGRGAIGWGIDDVVEPALWERGAGK